MPAILPTLREDATLDYALSLAPDPAKAGDPVFTGDNGVYRVLRLRGAGR